MRTFVFVTIVVACLLLRDVFGVQIARAEVNLNQATRDYLEGSWLIGEKPVRGPCTLQAYSANQFEFEFRNSGGRLIYYEAFDLFTNIGISGAEQKGGILFITLAVRKNETEQIRVRLLPPDGIILFWNSDDSSGKFAYRCGDPDRTVTDGIPASMLRILTSPASGSTLFVEAQRGLTAVEVCSPPEEYRSHEWRWLEFDVIGPVHYYVVGQGFEGRFDLQPIRSLHAVDDRTLKIEVLEHLADTGRAWDAGANARSFTLTAIWDGINLRIPELSASFIRCVGNPRDGYEPAPLPLNR